HIELRSKQSIVTLPRSALKVVDRAPLSLYFARLGYLRAWFRMAKVTLAYHGDIRSGERSCARYAFVARSMWKGRLLFALLYSYPPQGGGLRALHAEIEDRFRTLQAVVQWRAHGHQLFNLVNFASFAAVHSKIRATFETYRWLCSVEERLRALSQSVEEVVRDLARG